MKRILALFLVVFVLMGISMLTANAYESSNISDVGEPEGIYYKKFCDVYGYEYPTSLAEYEEIYFNYDKEGDVEWVLIYAIDLLTPPWNVHPYAVLGDRILRCNDTHTPFVVGYGIYDATEDEFKCITSVWESDLYEGLQSVLFELGVGEVIGDIYKDGKITIKDATFMQKCLAEIESYPSDDMVDGYNTSYYGKIAYMSDFNRDCNRNIEDATAIQKHLAKMDF